MEGCYEDTDKTKDNMKRNVSLETLVLNVFFYIWKQKVDFVEKIKEQRRKIGRNREDMVLLCFPGWS